MPMLAALQWHSHNLHWLSGAGEMKGIREAQQDLAGIVSENIRVICTSRGGIVVPHAQQLRMRRLLEEELPVS